MEHLIRIGGRGVFRYLMPWGATLCLALGVAASAAASGSHYYDWWKPKPRVLASGLIGATGATTGPDGALYVAQSSLGEIRRVDPRTGRKRLIASGLPSTDQTIGLGGLMDVEFIGKDMYALVTLQVDGVTTNGIYKRVGWNDFQPIADLGTFSAQNQPPPGFQVDVPIGVQFAMEPIDQGFLVSDGHHNRILHVAIDGLDSEISVLKQFGNTDPSMAT